MQAEVVEMDCECIYLMELRVIPPGTALAVWTDKHREPTYPELVQCLQNLVMTATAKGGNRTETTLMTCWDMRCSRQRER